MAVAAETLRTITDLTAGFLAKHPDVSFRLCQSPAAVMSAQLQAGEVDLCLASQPMRAGALESAELFSEEVLLCVPPGHRLAGRGRVTIGDLAGEPFVTTGCSQSPGTSRPPSPAKAASPTRSVG